MKINKISKTIKISSLVSCICLSIISIFIIACRLINWDILPDEYKHIVYNCCKYAILFCIIISFTPVIFALNKTLIQKRKTLNYKYNLTKNTIVLIVLICLIVLLFVNTNKYYVRLELWYRYISPYVSLIVFANCLIFNLFITNTNKSIKSQSNIIGQKKVLLFNISYYSFLFESIWIFFCCVIGISSMYYVKQVAETTTTIILLLLIEVWCQMIFIFYLNAKKSWYKTNKSIINLILMLSILAIICFIVSSYFDMFPIKIIKTIHINYFVALWNYMFALLSLPMFIIDAKLCYKIKNTK